MIELIRHYGETFSGNLYIERLNYNVYIFSFHGIDSFNEILKDGIRFLELVHIDVDFD